jgi:membrane-bound metal-dependent hydrolase YbcI (DUF457 family)
VPITPFHLGPALIAKAAAGRHFSLTVFGISQVMIDVEPLVGLLRGSAVLHGFTHTLGGATLIGVAAVVIGRPLGEWALGAWTGAPARISRTAVWTGAFGGTYSHLLLDGMMHLDMRPFAPFTDANPILGALTVPGIYLFCTVSGIVGALAMRLGIRRAAG